MIVRRDTREKIFVSLDEIESKLSEVLDQMQKDMLERAKKHLEENTHEAGNWDEFTEIIEKQQGFVKAMWCGETECEEAIKDETGLPPDVCLLYRNILEMYVCTAENLRRRWFFSEKHIKGILCLRLRYLKKQNRS